MRPAAETLIDSARVSLDRHELAQIEELITRGAGRPVLPRLMAELDSER